VLINYWKQKNAYKRQKANRSARDGRGHVSGNAP
jgi:hypothetical protein